MRVVFGLVWFTACLPAPGPAVDREQPRTDSEDSGQESPPVEVCNGLDDDRDGDIDEGFPDVDQDGIADCQDRDCELERAPVEVSWLPTCDRPLDLPAPTFGDPWDIETAWTWGRPSARGVLHPPLVGKFLPARSPQVLVLDDLGHLVVLDGPTGNELATFPGFDTSTTPALGIWTRTVARRWCSSTKLGVLWRYAATEVCCGNRAPTPGPWTGGCRSASPTFRATAPPRSSPTA